MYANCIQDSFSIYVYGSAHVGVFPLQFTFCCLVIAT